MKLPFLAALSALSLWGCATEAPSTRINAADSCVPISPTARVAAGAAAGPSEQLYWDAKKSPATQRLFANDANENSPLALGTAGSAMAGSGMGGSGTGGSGGVYVDLGSQVVTTMPTPPNPGAKFDLTPPSWVVNKGIGRGPVSPTTGTPAAEGSGGASGH